MNEKFEQVTAESPRGVLIKRFIAAAAGLAASVGMCLFSAALIGNSGEMTDDSMETDYIDGAPAPKVASIVCNSSGDDEENYPVHDCERAAGENAGCLKFTVEADGEEYTVYALPGTTVEAALLKAGVKPGKNDIVSCGLTEKVKNGSTVEINRVRYVKRTRNVSVDYDTVYRDDDSLPEGEERLLVEGVKGRAAEKRLVKIVDGKDTKTKLVSREITKEPVDEVILVGTAADDDEDEYDSRDDDNNDYDDGDEYTRDDHSDDDDDDDTDSGEEETPEPEKEDEEESYEDNSEENDDEEEEEEEEEEREPYVPISLDGSAPISRFTPPDWLTLDENGIPTEYKETFWGKSCAYTAEPGALMSTGKTVFQGYVAVNPDIIPYGSELYIVADNGAVYGYAIAADTGSSARKGHIVVDLFMDEYDDCILWGARNVTIYVLR